MKQTYIRLPDEIHAALVRLSYEHYQRTGRSLSLNAMVLEAIRAWLERQAEGRE